MSCFFHDWGAWETASWRDRDHLGDDQYGCWLVRTCHRCSAVRSRSNHDWHSEQDQEGFFDTYCRTCNLVRPQYGGSSNGW